jgi:hypothetical protein
MKRMPMIYLVAEAKRLNEEKRLQLEADKKGLKLIL